MKEEKKKKLAIITTWYPPDSGSFVQDQAIALAEIYEVHVFFFTFAWLTKTVVAKEGSLIVHRVQFPSFPKKTSWAMNYWINQSSKHLIEADKNIDFDIIHAHTFWGGFIAERTCKTINKDFFLTLHSTDLFKRIYPKVVDAFLPYTLESAAHVFCVGKALRSAVQNYQVKANITEVPNMVDMDKFSIAKEKQNGYNFVVIGDMDERKGLYEILQAFKGLKTQNTYLHIVGEISDMRVKSLSKNVVFHGKQSRKDTAQLLGKMHCLISFSVEETFGITVIEAMACGIPVLYCASGGPEDIVPEWAGIQVERSIEALQEAMIAIQKQDFDAEQIRNYAKIHYSNEAVRKQLVRLYEEV